LSFEGRPDTVRARMERFPEALEYVHATLCEWQRNGVSMTASLASLSYLAEAVAGAVPEPPSTREVPAPAAPVAAPLPAARAMPAPAVPIPPKPAAVPAQPAGDSSRSTQLAALRGPVLACTKCPNLVKSRTQVVFGVGNPEAALMFVGEAPGEDEDLQGEPFVGRAGQLLTKIIAAMGYTREQVYIANVLKCRPDMPPGASGNRKPEPGEMATCLPYLEQQIAIIQPRVLVALGNTAMEGLLGEGVPVARLRGQWQEFRGIPLMPTYHPAYLLRNQALSEKRKVWEHMLQVMEKLELPISEKQRQFFTK
jgi:DNA polymerase